MGKPSLLIIKSRVRLDPTFENHVGYIDISFANREYKKVEGVFLKSFGSNAPSNYLSQSDSKLTNTLSMYLDECSGFDIGLFLENLRVVFNVVEG